MAFWVGSSHSSHHPATFVGLAPCESKDKIFLISPVTTQLKFPLILSHHPVKYGVHRPRESGDITFLICQLITWLMCHVTLWVRSCRAKSPFC